MTSQSGKHVESIEDPLSSSLPSEGMVAVLQNRLKKDDAEKKPWRSLRITDEGGFNQHEFPLSKLHYSFTHVLSQFCS